MSADRLGGCPLSKYLSFKKAQATTETELRVFAPVHDSSEAWAAAIGPPVNQTLIEIYPSLHPAYFQESKAFLLSQSWGHMIKIQGCKKRWSKIVMEEMFPMQHDAKWAPTLTTEGRGSTNMIRVWKNIQGRENRREEGKEKKMIVHLLLDHGV